MKVWIFITAFSFITYIHHAKTACIPQDIKTHLDDELLEEYMFEIKVFSSETKEHGLLSLINALCSTWTRNKKKDQENLKVLKTFKMMLTAFSENFESFCVNLNCTEAYKVRWVNTAVFGDMYRTTCSKSISDLKCPSKSTTISPNTTAVEKGTTFFTTVDSITTAHKSTTSLTMVSPNISAPENLSTVSSASTETNRQEAQNLKSTIKISHGFLVFSILLNVVLFLLVLKSYLNKKTSTHSTHGEANLLRDRQQMDSLP